MVLLPAPLAPMQPTRDESETCTHRGTCDCQRAEAIKTRRVAAAPQGAHHEARHPDTGRAHERKSNGGGRGHSRPLQEAWTESRRARELSGARLRMDVGELRLGGAGVLERHVGHLEDGLVLRLHAFQVARLGELPADRARLKRVVRRGLRHLRSPITLLRVITEARAKNKASVPRTNRTHGTPAHVHKVRSIEQEPAGESAPGRRTP